jgi:hypothetical protein
MAVIIMLPPPSSLATHRNIDMVRIARFVLAFGLVGGLSVVVGIGIPSMATSQEHAEKKVVTPAIEQATFMRRKLEASNQILEGLVTEDSELVVKGAKVLIEMCAAEKWQVKHDVMYKQYSADFQQAAKKLVEAAEKENFDGVALKWIDTTMKCIECHKFVRGARLADGA